MLCVPYFHQTLLKILFESFFSISSKGTFCVVRRSHFPSPPSYRRMFLILCVNVRCDWHLLRRESRKHKRSRNNSEDFRVEMRTRERPDSKWDCYLLHGPLFTCLVKFSFTVTQRVFSHCYRAYADGIVSFNTLRHLSRTLSNYPFSWFWKVIPIT
jgi:hypothetical protein